MELYEDIICKEIGQIILTAYKKEDFDRKEIADSKSLQALQKIKTIIENKELSDFECIEEIVCVFEDIGSGAGSRHDFG